MNTLYYGDASEDLAAITLGKADHRFWLAGKNATMHTSELEDRASLDVDEKAAATLKRQADIILVLSVISILLCFVGGAFATYNAYQAQQDIRAGDLTGANQNIKMAKLVMILSYFVIPLIVVVWLVVLRFA
jgi:hypothetical protein